MANLDRTFHDELVEAFYLDLKNGTDAAKLRPRLLQDSTIAALDAAVARVEAEKRAAGDKQP